MKNGLNCGVLVNLGLKNRIRKIRVARGCVVGKRIEMGRHWYMDNHDSVEIDENKRDKYDKWLLSSFLSKSKM